MSQEEPPLGLIPIGADVVGAASGVAIAYLTNSPAYGAAGGALLSHTLKLGLGEMSRRLLGKREVKRIDATLDFAARKARENIEQGKQIRQDFFQEQPDDRSTAEETLEGILLTAQREYQEKKLRFYGNLWANIAFEPSVSREHANLLIKVGESLSYRQLCLLRLFAVKEQFGLRKNDYRSTGGNIGEGEGALLQEIFDLYSRGMINRGDAAMLGLLDVTPGMTGVQGSGAVLHNLMELWLIESQDLEQVASFLR